jgi:hypothetical protein
VVDGLGALVAGSGLWEESRGALEKSLGEMGAGTSAGAWGEARREAGRSPD